MFVHAVMSPGHSFCPWREKVDLYINRGIRFKFKDVCL